MFMVEMCYVCLPVFMLRLQVLRVHVDAGEGGEDEEEEEEDPGWKYSEIFHTAV